METKKQPQSFLQNQSNVAKELKPSQTTTELISIIVPCYNVAKFLDDCFVGLKTQTYKNFEVIFVNDGSTDNTLQKLTEYCGGEIPNAKIIDQKNQGVSAARNAGVLAAKGKYLCFVDPDDMISPFFLERLYENIANTHCDASVCSIKRIKENWTYKKVESVKSESVAPEILDRRTSFIECLHNGKVSAGPSDILYKKEILTKMESFPNVFREDIFYAEDMDMKLRYIEHCQQIAVFSEQLYYYRQRKNSAIHSKFNEKKLSVFKALNYVTEKYEDKDPKITLYARAMKSMFAFELLFRAFATGYRNPQVIQMLFTYLNDNKACLKQAKEIKGLPKHYIPVFCPLLKILFCGTLRKKSKKAAGAKSK